MRRIELTRGKFAIVDESDFETIDQWNWCTLSSGYAFRMSTGGKSMLMHRFILNAPKGVDVDHINGDKLDNRRENLRLVNRSENMANVGKKKNNTSGYKGVTQVSEKTNPKNRWMSQIMKNRKHIYLGYFPTPKDAAIAYNIKAIELFGDKAQINVIA